jgi:hypothetical protein
MKKWLVVAMAAILGLVVFLAWKRVAVGVASRMLLGRPPEG